MDDKLLNRIQKLLRLGNSPNEHEAQAALQKANEIAAQHGIELSSINFKEELGAVTMDDVQCDMLKQAGNFPVSIAQAAATLFDGKVLYGRRGKRAVITFVGFKSDIPAMKEMWKYFLTCWQSAYEEDLATAKKELYTVRRESFTPGMTMKFKTSHGLGFASRLGSRAKAAAEERKKAVQKASSGTALVLYKDQEVQNWYNEKFPKLKSTQSTVGSQAGYMFGAASGNSVALGGGVGHTAKIRNE